MQIDWITVSAQIVNFLVLVYLLQHFLYKPVIRAMDAREKRITDRLREAAAREEDAEREAGEYARIAEELESRRRSLLEQYRQEAREEKQSLVETARKEVQETRRHWQHQVEQEKRDFLADLRRRTEQTVTSIARKALTDLADTDLENRVVDVFIERLKELGDETRGAFASSRESLYVSTAFELDGGQRERIARAVRDRIREGVEIEFRVTPDLLCGIQIGDDGHALGWNLADYMGEVTGHMDNVIDNALRQS